MNQWQNRFYNALGEWNWDAFVSEILYFTVLAAVAVVIEAYKLYLNQWLQIRWRRWIPSAISTIGLKGPTIIACSCSAMPPITQTSALPRISGCLLRKR